MPGLGPGSTPSLRIHNTTDVDGRDKPGHDETMWQKPSLITPLTLHKP